MVAGQERGAQRESQSSNSSTCNFFSFYHIPNHRSNLTMEEQLSACLEGSLSPHAETRKQAEAQLLELHGNSACGLALSNLVLSTGSPLPLRQSAAVSLRKWIKERWSPLYDGFIGLPPHGRPVQSEDKAPVRQNILQALGLPGQGERKLRVAAAASLSAVCSSDWPDEFPELLPTVHSMLQPQTKGPVTDAARDQVHGALAFLSEFWSSEMDERQILGGAKDMLPTIEALLGDEQAYPASIRCRCVLIFRQLLSSLFMVREVYPDASKQIANDVLPRWIEALERLSGESLLSKLSDPSLSEEDKHGELALVNEVWQTLKIATHFRAQIKSRLPSLLNTATALLQRLDGPFTQTELVDDAEPLVRVPDGDSDISTSLPKLLGSIIDFVAEATRADRGRAVLVVGQAPSDTMRALIGSLIAFARVTTDEEEEWMADPNSFVAASDEDGVDYSLRVACCDLVQDLLEAYPDAALQCLGQAVQQSAQSGMGWKSTEAALAVLGGVAEEVTDLLGSRSSKARQYLDLEAIFQTAVLPNVQNQQSPLLTGRAYIFASQYATAIPQDLAQQFVQASVEALESPRGAEDSLIIKLSAAARCIKNFYRQLPPSLLSPFTPRIIANLGPLLLEATEDSLILIVETIQSIVGGDDESSSTIPPSTYAEITRAILNVWSNAVKDFILLSAISDLLESLASKQDPAVALAVLSVALPMLSSAVQQALKTGERDEEDLLEPAISLTEALLRGAKADVIQQTNAIQELCGPLIKALETTEDRDVLQSGVGCLTSLVRKCQPAAIVAWTDSTGTPAIQHFFSIISRLLTLDSESGGLKIGEFIVSLLRKLPEQVLSVLPDLLTAMVRRLANVKTASFAQSLILPFAFLMKDQSAVVLNLLESVQIPTYHDNGAPTGQEASGLEVLATKWIDNVDTLQGFWAQRISTLALTRLVESGRQSVASIQVKGELIPDESNLIRTRSRVKAMPDRYTSVSLPVKIVKLLIRDYEEATDGPPSGLAGLGGLGGGGVEDGVSSDDEDDDWDDEPGQQSQSKKSDGFLSDLLDNGGGIDELNALAQADFGFEGGDDELKEDEVYNMEMKKYLRGFFGGLAQSEEAGRIGPYLNGEEQLKLSGILASR